MASDPRTEAPPSSRSSWQPSAWHAALAICGACALVYAGQLSGPFVFDDEVSIVGNPTLAPLSLGVLSPPRETPVAGRPLANLTLGLDRARAGLTPAAFHLTNLVLHGLVAWLAWLVLRRLFALVAMPATVRERAAGLAFGAAVLFAVHPMTVEVVLYTTQRTESIVALAYLGIVYVLVRAVAEGSSRSWPLMALLGLLGAASKEVFVTAPVMALFLDRAFVAGSFAGALRARRPLYLALAASWVPLGLLQRGDSRPMSVRFAELDYVLAQAKIIPTYFASALFPTQPIFDYGPLTGRSAEHAWPWLVALVLVTAALTVLAFTRPRVGFLGVWVLGILAPTSTLFSIHTEVGAERRFYLPLIGVLAAVVLVADWLMRSPPARRAVPALLVIVALGLAARSRAYAGRFADQDDLWTYAAEVRPDNPRAHYNLAETHRRRGELREAESALRRALALDPAYVQAHVNLGGILMQQMRPTEALDHLHRASSLAPDDLAARYDHAVALGVVGRMQDAARELAEVVHRDPSHLQARAKLVVALRALGRADEVRGQLAWLEQRAAADPGAAALLRALRAPQAQPQR